MNRTIVPRGLVEDLRHLIVEERHDAASSVNSTLVVLYWSAGTRIHKEILKKKHAPNTAGRLSTH
jgi:hypothetical protein